MLERYRWLKGYLASYRSQILIALALGAITYGCAALLMFTSGYLIADTADPATTLFSVLVPVAFVQIFGLGRPIARYVERLVSHDWVFKITSLLRLSLFQGAERLERESGGIRALGTYLEVLTSDIGHLQNLFLRVVLPYAIAVILFLGACVLFGVFSWSLLLLMICCGIACVILLPYLSLLWSRKDQERCSDDRSRLHRDLANDVMGATDWIISGRSHDTLVSYDEQASKLARVKGSVRAKTEGLTFASIAFMGIALCVLVGISASTFQAPEGDPNWIAAFALGFFPLIEVFMLLPHSASEVVAHTHALDDLTPLIDHGEQDGAGEADEESRGTTAELPSSMTLEVQGLCFSYDDGHDPREVLHDLDLVVEPGEKVAILGRSGSGKSTLISLIRQLNNPKKGTIRINGEPTSELPWRPSGIFGYLDQNPFIFDRTLRENLDLAGDASDEKLLAALEAVGLKERFDRLEEGLDTPIGETGIGFSGGEAHRIALARILVADTPMVILDEPFSALDPVIERALLRMLFQTMQDKTVLIVTHHLAEIDNFDRVVFIEDGTIALEGTPADLRGSSPYFQQLCEADRSVL